MMQRTSKPASRRHYVGLIAVTAIVALTLGAATFYAVQKLSRDDCTTTTSRMPDGSHITIETCS